MSVSIAFTLGLALFSVILFFIDNKIRFFLSYATTAVAVLGISFYARWLTRQEHPGRAKIYGGILAFFFCLMALGLYSSVMIKINEQAISFMLFLICSQILFVMNPGWILCMNLAAVAVFSCFAITLKPAVYWRADVVNVCSASLAGMAFNWYISHLSIREMLTIQRLELERNRFREESIKDELTGLSNRRDYLHAVDFYISVSQHVHQTVCALMMDVDFFKKYNDFYGHPKGDTVLQSLGSILRQLITEEKVFAARVGGEEFIVLWTENRIAEAERIAIKLRQMILDFRMPHAKSPISPYVTASIGLYILRGGSTDTAEDLYNRADMALYEAKKQGRNCIILYDSADMQFKAVTPLPPEENTGRR